MSLEYKNLVAWQRADDLFCRGSSSYASTISVPANIVEGNARQTGRDKLRFFNMASASLSELTYGLHSARRLGYIDRTEYKRLDDLAKMVAAPLHGLIRKRRAALVAKTAFSIAVCVLTGSALLL